MNNGLLALLSPDSKSKVLPLLEPVELTTGQVLHHPLESIDHVYFFEGGLSSEVLTDSEGEKIEVGCVGKEGFSGIPVVLGVASGRHKSFMEIGGAAQRIPSRTIIAIMDELPEVRWLLLRYVHVFMAQVASTVLADGRYEIYQRLARWILMAHDRVEGNEIALTHDFLALMLGVRRSGVTTAIHILEGDLAIKAERGLITVRDRPLLEKIASGCYGLAEAEYNRIMLGQKT